MSATIDIRGRAVANDVMPRAEVTSWDIAALRRAFETHARFVRRSAARLGVPPAHIDDATQDVFVVLVRRADDFGPCRSVRALLFSIVRRVASAYRRRARPLPTPPAAARDAPGPADRVEAALLVTKFLAELDLAHREVFILAEFEGMSAPEIREALGGLNINTVYTRLRAARLRLRALVRANEAADERRR